MALWDENARNCRAADIDDAVQETLLLLYRRVGTLRAVTSFSAWLFAVARPGISDPGLIAFFSEACPRT